MSARKPSPDRPRWRVPYSAPGIRRGHLLVFADSREDAINAAIEVHGRRWRDAFTGNPSWRLHAGARAAIDYGEPEPANVAALKLATRGAA